MKNMVHTDSCSIGSSVDDVKVSVVFRGAHTGGFRVEKDGNPIQPNGDGTVSVGKADTLRGSSILVVTIINQIGPTQLFEIDYIVQGVACGPFVVQDSFDTGDPDVTLKETIKFI
jgi:hypothetical protein